MPPDISIKICGLREPDHLELLVAENVRYAGFVFFEKSPRNLEISAARALAHNAPPGLAKVALVVDADNAKLDAITSQVPLDMLQLQGRETPERVQEIKTRYGLPTMKAVGVATADDLPALDQFAQVADQILVDAKPPKDAKLPGGNGLTFDWRLIAGRRWSVPWMLAGGLTPDNIAEAIRLTGTRQVDVSSSVESAPGVKSPERIRRFVAAALAQEPAGS